MSGPDFLDRRSTRTRQYGAKPLDPNRSIALRIDAGYAETYAGQAGLLTAANLIGRMTPNMALDVPASTRIRPPLPWAGQSLRDVLFAQLHAATPVDVGGCFSCRAPREGDCILSFGATPVSGAVVVHGCGWNSYIGGSPSPLSPVDCVNPCGPTFAAILAGAHLMTGGANALADYLCNTLDWTNGPTLADAPQPNPDAGLGELWTIGTGSVGTAALYFLTLFTQQFSTALIDKDHVEVENLDRSPIFLADDVEDPKVIATQRYLRQVGVTDIRIDPSTLGESDLWLKRQEGEPDIVIAAANEDNVRYQIEAGMPPIQIYGTTGKVWQASLIRHIPMREPCSLCVFPETGPALPMACATGSVPIPGGKSVDAALPFLSFAAGLMAAAEILKLDLPGYPFSQAQVHYWSRAEEKLIAGKAGLRSGCICRQRDTEIHRHMIARTRYASLSAG